MPSVRSALAGVGVAALLASGLAFAPVTATTGRTITDGGPPTDYIAQADQLSQPDHPETITEVLQIPAHDGELLYVEVTRPDPAAYPGETFPVILEASPYHGTIATRIGDRIFPDPKDEDGNNLGLTGYFAPRGYAVAMMDLRGTGRSGGCLDHLGPNDAEDLRTVIEHLADAEWSAGKVGMTGHSYVGSTPTAATELNPRGLATIVPSAGLASMYDHQFQAGVPYLLQYVGPMVAYESMALDRHLPPGTPSALGDNTGDDFGNNPEDTGCGMQNSSLTAGSGQVTGQYELWHAERDHRQAGIDTDIPVFMIHGVNDNAARIPGAECRVVIRQPLRPLPGQGLDRPVGPRLDQRPLRRHERWARPAPDLPLRAVPVRPARVVRQAPEGHGRRHRPGRGGLPQPDRCHPRPD